ncbi:MAG: hypothetical protein JXX14_13765 [Deltaproteobacteria bacterium]|nr:hypothetical protein [Deltaproteobacteria bacterium]
MPILKKKTENVPPSRWELTYADAAGKSTDFYVNAHCYELDEFERSKNINHTDTTFVFHFDSFDRKKIIRNPTRLDALWREQSGVVLAAGDTRGYLEINASEVSEVALSDVPGQFSCFWALNDDHLYACGGFEPFFYYRYKRKWFAVPLPENCPPLWSIAGLNEKEIYVVGGEGIVLLFNGKTISRIECPTDRMLTSVAVLNDRYVCIGGYEGILIIGNRNGWRFVPTGSEEPLLKIATYGGKVFFGAEDGLWSFDGRNEPVHIAEHRTRWMSALEDGLLFGNGQAYLYVNNEIHPIDNMLNYPEETR